jgi:ABC-type nitrate/sulfonate/bicarbonate transport system ATPase subunit
MTLTTAHVQIRQVSKTFGDAHILDGIDLDLTAGQIVSVVGPSGSGKSTLLSILTGATQPDSGQVLVDGAPLDGSTRPFAFMPQRDVLLPWRRIIDNAGVGLQIAGSSRREARATAGELFEDFGLVGTERLYPRQLSGGMRQRVSLLRTVVQGRPVMLLDEPFGALDAITRDELQQWLLGMWRRHGWTILLITHDIREAVLLSDVVHVFSPRPARILASVQVDRSIDRGADFGLDPRVPPLEAQLHAELIRGMRGAN